MLKHKLLVGAALAAVTTFQAAQATPIIASSTGLTSPAQVITFDEVTLGADAVVTDQFSSFGVTFSPQVFYNPSATAELGLPENRVANFERNDTTTILDPIELLFGGVHGSVAVQMGTTGGQATLTAFLGSAEVERFSANTPFGSSNNFFGFDGIRFDRLSIDANGNGAQIIAEIQLDAAQGVVDEPASLGLLGLALLGGGLAARRRRGVHPAA